MEGNISIWETQESAANSVRAVLPSGWQVGLTFSDAPPLDTILRITSTTGESADFEVAVQQMNHDRTSLLTSLIASSTVAKANGRSGLVLLSPYLSAPLRGELAKANISYADATGWVRLVSNHPMLAITATGADRAPGTATRRQTLSLKGASAGRIVRTLLSHTPPIGVRDLAQTAMVSPGTVSKILPILAAEDAIGRNSQGTITDVNRRQTLNRWTLDYHILTSNGRPSYFVAPRGIGTALTQLTVTQNVVLTGIEAGTLWLPDDTAPVIPVTHLVAYTTTIDKTASSLGLIPVDPSSANFILLTPQDSMVLENPTIKNGLPIAPLPLVLADLLTLPGRYPQQAEALMDALGKTDPAWRAS